jgi:hypothetical protein
MNFAMFWVTGILTFLTLAIKKSEISKFQISLKETKILQSTFESTKSESESQQSTLKLNESKELYQKIS